MRLLLAATPRAASTIPIHTLSATQLVVDMAPSGADCLEMASLYEYDIIVLDLGLTDPSGYEVLKTLRRYGKGPCILALCPDAEAEGRVRALNLGADDCMARPLDRAECLARIQAVVRRAKGHAHSVIQFGDLELDISRKTAEVAGKQLRLTFREYGILEVLGLRRGSVIHREMVMNHLYGEEDWPDIKIIDIYIHRLRRKIAEAGGVGDYIRTAWGRGFCLDAPDKVLALAGAGPEVRAPAQPAAYLPRPWTRPAMLLLVACQPLNTTSDAGLSPTTGPPYDQAFCIAGA